MKKFTFAFALALFANNALADWVLIDSSNIGNLYFNNAKIKSKDGVVRAWTLMSFSNTQFTENKAAYSSRVAIAEYDCSNSLTNLLSLNSYTERMGAGGVVEVYENREKDWMKISPNTLIEKAFETICRNHQ
jgi:hypothetical protein